MTVYIYDEQGFYKGYKQVADGYKLGMFETTISADFKLNSKSTFDGTTWHDLSESAYMHDNPAPRNEKRIIPETPKPATSPEQKMISQLALQQAQFQANQQKLNSQLALQLATLTTKGD